MQINFRQAALNDLDRIMVIEESGFTPEEAATREAMAERIAVIPDTFILATDQDGTTVGYVVGPVIKDRYLHDDLFEKTVANPSVGGYVGVLSLVVDPAFHAQGIASKLLDELADRAKKSGRVGISLTCLEGLIPFYERNGYVNEGISDSTHAGETWYNLVLYLK